MHPIALLGTYKNLLEQIHGHGFEFEFSKYVYVPQEVSESRYVFRASFENAHANFEKQRQGLEQNEEIAFHSRLIASDQSILHIPLIDMGCEKIESHLPQLKKAFKDFGIPKFDVFSSGRSFHIYGHGLLKGDWELVKFMGRILLLNLPMQERVIDERWVGHRLMAKYLTLRWTNNNPHYKAVPQKIFEVEID